MVPLDPASGKKLPLHAFALLEGGDAFDVSGGAHPKDGKAKAAAYFAAKVTVRAMGLDGAILARFPAHAYASKAALKGTNRSPR